MSDWNAAVELAARIVETDATWPFTGKSKQIATTIRLLKRPADQDGWMPIESAPRDGTPFLGYWLRRYSNGERYEAVQPQCVCHFMNGRLFPSWIEENKDYPTHWRPLPSAPTPEAK